MLLASKLYSATLIPTAIITLKLDNMRALLDPCAKRTQIAAQITNGLPRRLRSEDHDDRISDAYKNVRLSEPKFYKSCDIINIIVFIILFLLKTYQLFYEFYELFNNMYKNVSS